MTTTTRQNPFALSLCGHFVVERYEGDVYPNVMPLAYAMDRQKRSEANGAAYEGSADHADRAGLHHSATTDRAFARLHLTIAADLAEVLADVSGFRADGKRSAA